MGDFKLGMVVEPAGDYHARTDVIGTSHIKEMLISPYHYWGKYVNPERPPNEPTPAMIIGSATHAAVLEPETFEKIYTRRPNGIDGRTKDGKAQLEALRASGKEMLTGEDWDLAMAMRKAVATHPVAKQYLTDGVAEMSVYAKCDITGLHLKCRPDWLNGMIVDLKTTEDASPDGFMRSVVKYGYDIQQFHYQRVLELATGETSPPFIFIAVEKKYPHAVGCYMLDPHGVERAGQCAMRNISKIKECRESGVWPDFSSEGASELFVPQWARR